ncbi:protein LONG AFTER FAR-RED 3 [Pistacia vera]|uniref:protein LONG AFTER FAR-RED 3 n=1 Tax=Pistacia vera TaxID=55513 RepID=UPI0012630E82|nr:protein LONG AFTER FAR-RED 3 [Pistacia vera]
MNLYTLIPATIFLALSLLLLPLLNNYWLSLTPSTPSVADLILRNGVIFTSDESLPFADSMAILNGRILRVGNYSSIQELAGDGTKELNLEGKFVVPGFIDSHVHLIWGGLQMAQVELHGVNCKDEFVRRVKAVRNLKKGSWILGGGWNNDLWGGDLPMTSWIDDITPDNPVWLSRMDGHMGLANSVALQMAGITNLSEDPAGGTIMRTSSGEPTGLLVDAAMKLILPWIPEVSVDERREALFRASKHALMRGVTTVVDIGRYLPGASLQQPWDDFSDVYQWAVSSEKMRIRVCLFFPIQTWSRLADLINKTGHAQSDWVYLGGVKAFVDGSLGSNSALFHEPYADEPDNYGLQIMDPESLLNMTLASDKSGLQVAIHAIGDKANDLILDMYKSVAATTGKRDRRFRIEHAQHLAPGAAARFGDQGVVASVQPQHLLDDADSAIKKLGMDRAHKASYLFGSLLAGNAQLALGSDWPVVDINPLGAIKTAMKRIPPGWDDAWIPSERISLIDSLIAHTSSAARGCFLENYLGSLSPGKLADFVILSTSSWEDFAAEGTASVEATYVSGMQAYP